MDVPAYFIVVSDFYQPKIGWTMHNNLRLALENIQLVGKNDNAIIERLTTEVQPFEENKLFKEGKVLQVMVDKFERNQDARIAAIIITQD